VIAQNGKEASFLAGGEYPYPVVQGVTGGGAGAVTIQFKEYGIRLNFIPTITPRGTIHLQVAPEVSSLDFTNAVEVSGFDVPAIDIRNVKTEVEIGDGQSFAIGGLLDNNETKTFEKIPFLGDIPILGKFFQSVQKTRNNTELIVIVTPEFVDPIPVGAPLPALNYPDKFLDPNSKIPMHNPDTKEAGVNTPPQPTTMPVEQLIQQTTTPEQPLVIESGAMTPGGGTTNTSQAPVTNPTPTLTTGTPQ
jgi:pilus assembly protein CpaC